MYIHVYPYIIRIKHLDYLWQLNFYNLVFNIVSNDLEWALHHVALAFNLSNNSNLENKNMDIDSTMGISPSKVGVEQHIFARRAFFCNLK